MLTSVRTPWYNTNPRPEDERCAEQAKDASERARTLETMNAKHRGEAEMLNRSDR